MKIQNLQKNKIQICFFHFLINGSVDFGLNFKYNKYKPNIVNVAKEVCVTKLK